MKLRGILETAYLFTGSRVRIKPLWNYRTVFKPLIFLSEVVWREVRKDVVSVKRFTEFVWTES